MAHKHKDKIPNKIRPYLKDSDIPRFHNVFSTAGHSNYSDTVELLLDVFEESGNLQKSKEVLALAYLVTRVREDLKKINPSLLSRFDKVIKEDGRN